MKPILAAAGLIFAATGCPAPNRCNNACSTAGATQCSGSQVQTCTTDANGCLNWSTPTSCGTSQFCSGSSCTSCASPNPCPSASATQCSGLQVQTCVASANGCFAWSAPADCHSNLTCNAVQNKCADHLVTLSWGANHETGVNSAGGGYKVSISGQSPIDVPYASGAGAQTSTTTRLPPGTYTVTALAYARLDAQGGSSGSASAPSQTVTFTVP
jgi:hypothetical protein